MPGVVDPRPNQVGRHQVRGELDPAGGAPDHLRERLHGDGFGQPRNPFQQDVPPGEQRDQQTLEQAVLADDQAFDFEQDLLDGRRHAGRELPSGLGRARGVFASDERSIDHETLPAMTVLRFNRVEMSHF